MAMKITNFSIDAASNKVQIQIGRDPHVHGEAVSIHFKFDPDETANYAQVEAAAKVRARELLHDALAALA